jgi:hypothetical protein
MPRLGFSSQPKIKSGLAVGGVQPGPCRAECFQRFGLEQPGNTFRRRECVQLGIEAFAEKAAPMPKASATLPLTAALSPIHGAVI